MSLLAGFVGANRLDAQCVGDCDRNGTVGVDELVRAVDIALGTVAISACPVFDAGADGRLSVDQLVRAVGSSLTGCGRSVIANGICRRPGTEGLEPCASETEVRVGVCEDRERCLDDQSSVRVIGFARISAQGQFSMMLDAADVADAPLIFEANVEPATATKYRVLAFARLAAGSGGGAELDEIVIDPNTEAAVQLIDQSGLENLSDQGVTDVVEAVQTANVDLSFAGVGAADAVVTATSAASKDPAVMMAIQNAMVTPTPTPTETPTPTPTPIPRLVLVTNFGDDTVTLRDGRTGAFVDTLSVGDAPVGIAITPDGGHAFVVDEAGDTAGEGFSIVDLRARTVNSFPDYAPDIADGPTGVAITPAGHAYVANRLSATVDVIDVAQALMDPPSARITRIVEVGSGPNGVAAARTEPFVYVSLIGGNGVAVIDTDTNQVETTVPLPNEAILLALTPDDSTLYVTRPGTSVSVIDTLLARIDPGSAVSEIPVGDGPTGVAVAPAGDFAYVVSFGAESLSVIDTSLSTVIRTVSLSGTQPTTIALSPDGSTAYVCLFGTSKLALIDTEKARSDPEHAVTGTFPVGLQPQMPAVVDLP